MSTVMVAAIATYSNTLLNGFVRDDEAQVLSNPWLHHWSGISAAFRSGAWGFEAGNPVTNYYRPLMHVAYIAIYHAFGLRPWAYHAVNIALHAVATGLVFTLARVLLENHARSTSPVAGAFVAGLVFATHPIHTEVVAWVAAIPDLLMTVFCLAAFLLHRRRSSWASAAVRVPRSV